MAAPAAFQATFSDFKLIRGRKVAQVVLEVPIEAADAALETLGGLPRPDAERWVAVARLVPATEKPVERQSAPAPTVTLPEKPRRPFDDLAMSAQAALKCNDPAFQRFMVEMHEAEPGESGAADAVRAYCGVTSRSAIMRGSQAAGCWRDLLGRYRLWMTEDAYV
jgi:hypothetical protein